MECLAVLIVAGLEVGEAIDGLHLPLGILECHFFIPLLFRIYLLFAFPLAGRHAFSARLLLSLTELLYELLDLPTLTRAVARRVMHHALPSSLLDA
jgi:hypothetical protein